MRPPATGSGWKGDEFTVGDLMTISVLGGLRGTGELGDFPLLASYVARGEGRPVRIKAMNDHMAVFAAPAPILNVGHG